MEQTAKPKILIADDSEMNRSILADMLEDEYEIIEAENGAQAVAILGKHSMEISLVLLDIVMPEMNGFEALTIMNQNRWIEDVPVIMISAESSSSHIQRAYELGVTDFIARPFDALVVQRRVTNTILLYAKQKKLAGMVMDQIYEREKQNSLMIDILSHIVEFRNGESGLHVLHIRKLTDLFLKHLSRKSDRYKFSRSDIALISVASALHDIGKISIPNRILNKPGRLTKEEFEEMKTHTTIGASMLEALPVFKSEPLVQMAYQICRWHHERYDGRGYPDGLKGDDIPIAAQIVALADVYDALTSERVYKAAIPSDKAIEMILDGQCGAFNPMLLECLTDLSDQIRQAVESVTISNQNRVEIHDIVDELRQYDELSASERTLRLLEHERMKYSFFASLSQEIQFEYVTSPSMATLSAWGAEHLGTGETIMDPVSNEKCLEEIHPDDMRELSDLIRSTTPEDPVTQFDCLFHLNGEARWTRIISRTMWSSDEPPRYMGVIGKAVDVHEERVKMEALQELATHDALTGLFNHRHAKERILERLQNRPNSLFAMVIFDLDHFKSANDTYGHIFGDKVLIHVAEKLRHSVRGGDIAARVGGDEFLIFLEYHRDEIGAAIDRIYKALVGQFQQFKISISMGVAQTQVVGSDYDMLFHSADLALYSAKRGGRGKYLFYTHSMESLLSVLSPIESDQPDQANQGAERQINS